MTGEADWDAPARLPPARRMLPDPHSAPHLQLASSRTLRHSIPGGSGGNGMAFVHRLKYLRSPWPCGR